MPNQALRIRQSQEFKLFLNKCSLADARKILSGKYGRILLIKPLEQRNKTKAPPSNNLRTPTSSCTEVAHMKNGGNYGTK